MNLDLDPADPLLREEIRTFFAENVPEDFKPRVRAGMRLEPAEFTAWQKRLHARGWGAPTWPREYGGKGWTPTQLYIFDTEAARADAPAQFHQGLELIGPIIFTFGTPAQKARYLPAIVSGDDWWRQGYSKPGAEADHRAPVSKLRRSAARLPGGWGARPQYHPRNKAVTQPSSAMSAIANLRECEGQKPRLRSGRVGRHRARRTIIARHLRHARCRTYPATGTCDRARGLSVSGRPTPCAMC
jgi:hypothetical protein